MEDHHGLFAVLEQYLKALDLSALNRVVFCGDGAAWIWSGVERLCQKLELNPERVEQVIDYPHAKQNLQEIFDLLPARFRTREHLEKRWKTLLWQGDIQALHDAIARVFSGKKKQAALAKWDRYFHTNQARMQYEHFKHNAIPCGSGCVESAIRRVINLRLKAPGSFWTRAMAECFLFLRSQLLSGRWDIFLHNLTHQLARMLETQPAMQRPSQAVELPQAA